ncbi:hypothetical protein [Pimelobacter simplex]|uniref:hypothetical protein n=1 Tax=Nocardioides simplex TaxID=2045 RepID=UPI0021504C04|nr:hypothetical protein [Pimelobacter simplex]UUW88482.1 hypothetical protein M0M43_22445 [Pimelobacter simplex]UUW97986.1 hypothetical protein M0M48_11090 [Pimelobacter simplex]
MSDDEIRRAADAAHHLLREMANRGEALETESIVNGSLAFDIGPEIVSLRVDVTNLALLVSVLLDRAYPPG